MEDEKPPIVTGPVTNLAHLVPPHVLPNGSGGPHGTTKGPKMSDQREVHKVGSDLPPYVRNGEEEEVEQSPTHGKRGRDKTPRRTRRAESMVDVEPLLKLLHDRGWDRDTASAAKALRLTSSYINQMKTNGEMPSYVLGLIENERRRHSKEGHDLFMGFVPPDKTQAFTQFCQALQIGMSKVKMPL